jgi:tetratricopeptide (TPR) repeat protein
MNKKLHIYLIVFLFSLQGLGIRIAYADNYFSKKDSLKKEINRNENKAEKSKLFFQLAQYYSGEDKNDSALYLYKTAYQLLSDTISSEADNILNEIGLIYYHQGDFGQALASFKKALKIVITNNDSTMIARRYGNIGVIYDHLGDYVKSIEYYQKALEIFEEQDFKKGMAFIYNNMGVISEEMGNSRNALIYHMQALKIKTELSDKSGMGNSLNNIGVVYEQLLSNYDSAIYYHKLALGVFRNLNDKRRIAISLSNIGAIHLMEHDIDSAIFYSEKALEFSRTINDENGISSALLNLGNDYYEKGDFQLAESYYLQCLKTSQKISSRKKITEIYDALAKLYHRIHQDNKAYGYHLKYSMLKDSLINEENTKQIAELKTRYELEKKDKQLKILSHENYLQKESITHYNFLLVSILLIASLISVIAILLVRQNRLKARQQTIELQQKLLRSQMNPHFIFNTLFSIQTYMLENDAISASRFLSKFAKLMRHILENSKHEFVTLENEIEFVNEYLFIQQLRFDESFKYEVVFDEKEEEASQIMIPPMLSQPFIENAIDHGIRNIERKGIVKLVFSISENNLIVSIEDNGIGFYHKEHGHQKLKNHKSTGVENTRQRIKILAAKYKSKDLFEIRDLNQENPQKNGTIITFAIPLIFA